MTRIAAREKFLWRGWEFALSRADSKEAHWQMQHGDLRIRIIYRDIQDPESPPEFTAIIQIHGVTAGEGIGAHHEVALAHAERDLTQKLRNAVRLLAEIRRGKASEPSA